MKLWAQIELSGIVSVNKMACQVSHVLSTYHCQTVYHVVRSAGQWSCHVRMKLLTGVVRDSFSVWNVACQMNHVSFTCHCQLLTLCSLLLVRIELVYVVLSAVIVKWKILSCSSCMLSCIFTRSRLMSRARSKRRPGTLLSVNQMNSPCWDAGCIAGSVWGP